MKNFKVAPRLIPLFSTAFVLVALYAVGCLNYRNFGSANVFLNLLGDNAYLGVAAVGATFVILSGGIDLSIGAVVAFTCTLIASLVERGAASPIVAILVSLAAGAAFGACMGFLIHQWKLPAFLVTLAGMFLARSVAFMIEPQSLSLKNPFYTQTLAQDLNIQLGENLSLPFLAVCALVVFVLAHWLLSSTKFGRSIYAIGGDEESARMMGLNIWRTKIGIYTISGFCSALAGVMYSIYTGSGDPVAGNGFELDAIAAVVIGGTLLTGGVGYVGGTAMGVLILGLIQTLITFQGDLNSWWTRIAVGALVLIFLLLQRALSSFSRPSLKLKAS